MITQGLLARQGAGGCGNRGSEKFKRLGKECLFRRFKIQVLKGGGGWKGSCFTHIQGLKNPAGPIIGDRGRQRGARSPGGSPKWRQKERRGQAIVENRGMARVSHIREVG
eukprot:1337104-Amorphochlora_amoeboformis.AAC.2